MASFFTSLVKKFTGNPEEDNIAPAESLIEESESQKEEQKGSRIKNRILKNKDDESDETEDIEDEKSQPVTESVEKIRSMVNHVIKPEERTLKNYLSISFWKRKNDEYREIKEKEQQDLNVYAVLSEGARPTMEYYVLTILSCIIATIGLIQGSTAVIIGAMIVAPLMTPILALSLAVIWGDFALSKTSISSILKGVFWAIIISAAITYVIPMGGYSDEIISRTRPSMYDIMVALASGIVGAYGYANKKISNSLIGIAIAVALMPPLCTIGIGLGSFNLSMAWGAFVLFLINLVSIGLAGAAIFWIMEIHPILADKESVKRRALSQIIISVLVLLAIAIPVGFYMYEGYSIKKAEAEIKTLFEKDMTGFRVHDMTRSGKRGEYVVDLTLSGHQTPDIDNVNRLIKNLKDNYPMIKKVVVNYLPVITR